MVASLVAMERAILNAAHSCDVRHLQKCLLLALNSI